MVVVPNLNDSRFPGITLIVVLGCLVFYLIPETTIWAVYDREQLLHGDIWRLFTGHFVHFSWRHLFFNLSVFAVLGFLLELRNRWIFLWLIALTTLSCSLYFLLFIPEMSKYRGLSGLVSAAVVYLALNEIRATVRLRFIWVLILILFLVKVGYEIFSGEAVFASGSDSDFIIVPAAHIIGAVMAAFIFIWKKWDGGTKY